MHLIGEYLKTIEKKVDFFEGKGLAECGALAYKLYKGLCLASK